jgi:nucleotide-binding universal stress UspA family protein
VRRGTFRAIFEILIFRFFIEREKPSRNLKGADKIPYCSFSGSRAIFSFPDTPLNNGNAMYISKSVDMFEKVLLPTDLSPDSQRILGYVRDIPGVTKVTLLHVVKTPAPSRQGPDQDPQTKNPRILLDENRKVLEKAGVAADLAVETMVKMITQGDLPFTILETAETEKVSLIMMGARAKNTDNSILTDSVSANVIRSAKVPVLLLRFAPESGAIDNHRNLFSCVLVPVDFSKPSVQTLALVKGIPTAGRVILMHVVNKGKSDTMDAPVQSAVQAAQKRLEIIQKDLAAAGIPAEVRACAGYAPDEINATAERDNVTLILMSPHGEGWTRNLRTLFIGSTTSAVMRRVHRPVLVTAGQMTVRGDEGL